VAQPTRAPVVTSAELWKKLRLSIVIVYLLVAVTGATSVKVSATGDAGCPVSSLALPNGTRFWALKRLKKIKKPCE
jgi:hypothetical protein